MKVTKIILGLGAAAMLFACSPKKEESKTSEAQEVTDSLTAPIYTVLTDSSVINWEGSKAGIDSKHNGTMTFKSGSVMFDADSMQLVGGEFIMDMNSINNLDQQGELKAQLEGHLKSADFFDVEKFPEAKFVITSATKLAEPNRYHIVGNLTIKDATNSVEFDSTVAYDATTKTITAESDEIVIDRTKWGVNYNSKNVFKDLKDNIIADQISIKLHGVAQMQ